MRTSIFRPITKKESKINKWIKKKMIEHLQKSSPEAKRWHWIHRIVKFRFMHPFLKFLGKFMGKYLIKGSQDIPAEKYNNHIRIFFDSWEKALKDMLIGIDCTLRHKSGPEIEKYKKTIHTNPAYTARMLLLRLWLTEILEDTADREWLNFFMLRMYHEMHELYGGNVPDIGEFPHYLSLRDGDISYFMKHDRYPLWESKYEVDLENGKRNK